ncbi:MAG: glycosyltransferase family 1 protein [Candidatus Hydrogenedentota bacterium]|nr:MAG: glycosyltransferase family 1 protein [Candidatus Hydrogenedentota bacterium]
MEKKKVMRVIARLNVGGPARHVVWLSARLDRCFETRLVTGFVEANEEEMTSFYRAEGITPVYIRGLGRSIGLRDLPAFFRLLCEMRRFRPDIVHTHTAKAGLLGRSAALLLNLSGRRIRTVHTFHGHVLHGYFSAPVSLLFRLLERFLGHVATDRVIAISRQQFEELCFRYKVAPQERFRIIPLGLDLAPLEAVARNRPSHPRKPPRIGFIGRLTSIKEPHVFLEAIRRVQKTERDAVAVIAGDGELRSELEQIAPPGTRFLGNRSEIAEVLSEIDLLALSSRNEGTPLSIIEAFAAGVPVASTAAGGCIDLLADGRGLLSPIGEPDLLAQNILRLLRDEPLRSETIRRASEFARSHYNLDRLLSDIESLYSELLQIRNDRNDTGEAKRVKRM